MENPFFNLIDKYGWHLTIKGFLQAYGHFDRFERPPLLELDIKKFRIIKKVSKKFFLNSKKLSSNGYFKNIIK